MSEYEREARRERLEALRSDGVEPYPARTGDYVSIASVRERFDSTSAEDLEAQPPEAAIVGRVMAQRSFGKLIFLHLLQDGVRKVLAAWLLGCWDCSRLWAKTSAISTINNETGDTAKLNFQFK